MKQVEKIWAELSAKAQEVETPQESTELSEEVKVELTSASDLNSAIQKINNTIGDILNPKNSAEASLRSSLASVKRAYSLNKEIQSAMKAFEQKSKELGMIPEELPVYKEAVKEYRDFEAVLGRLEQEIDQALKALN
jgi:hypothetical protein